MFFNCDNSVVTINLNTIFSSEYKPHMPNEQELISAIEEERNFELSEI